MKANFYSYIAARDVKVDIGCGLQLVLSLTRVLLTRVPEIETFSEVAPQLKRKRIYMAMCLL